MKPTLRRPLVLLLLLLVISAAGCALGRPLGASTPAPVTATPTVDLTSRPYAGNMKATGEVMKATAFAQARATPAFFRETPNLWSLTGAIPGLLFALYGLGAIRHYERVRRRRWAAGITYRGFQITAGVARGKQAIRGAKMELWAGLFFLLLGALSVVFMLLVTFIN